MKTHYISLGYNCDGATWLRNNQLRDGAMPFDWAVTPIRSVIKHFENDFTEWMLDENLIYNPPAERKLMLNDDTGETVRDMTTPVVDKKYGTLYPHDFGVEYDINEVRAKYRRRIDRMKELFADKNNKFVFVMHEGNIHEYQVKQFEIAGVKWSNLTYGWEDKFRAVLDQRYSDLNWKITTLKDLQFYGV